MSTNKELCMGVTLKEKYTSKNLAGKST